MRVLATWLVLTLVTLSHATVCTPPPQSEPQTEAEQLARLRSQEAWARLETYLPHLPPDPDAAIFMPVAGVRVRQIADTFGALRGGGRFHEGQDIFAPRGTPIYPATDGFVWRVEYRPLGGNTVMIVGAGGWRYYYAHLERYAENLLEDSFVTTQTVIGYVGNTGNAVTTPPHLHFGVYMGSRRTCDYAVIDPLPLLLDR